MRTDGIHLLLQRRANDEEGLEIFCEFVEKDGAWACTNPVEFAESWKDAKKIARGSQTRRERLQRTKAKVISLWGPLAEEWIVGYRHTKRGTE